MSDYIKELLRERANKIRSKLENGFLYGELVDMNNLDAIIVATYELAKSEEINENMKRWKIMGELIDARR